jgi:AcrR family transcriptional regulator
VGAARREKTRLRLLESALSVFANKGPDEAMIEDFIAAAGVARGTFYNYFRTTSELLAAVSGQMSDEVLCVVDPLVQHFDDPAERVAAGTRLYMEMAHRYPLWGMFITRVGARLASRGKLLDVYLNRDIASGMKSRRFAVANALVTRDIVLGSIFYGIETMLTEPTHEHHAEELVATFLRGMGLDAAEAQRIAFMPLPPVGPIQGPIFSRLPQAAPLTRKRQRSALQ